MCVWKKWIRNLLLLILPLHCSENIWIADTFPIWIKIRRKKAWLTCLLILGVSVLGEDWGDLLRFHTNHHYISVDV